MILLKEENEKMTGREVIDHVEANGLEGILGLTPERDEVETAKVANYLGNMVEGKVGAREEVIALLARPITLFEYKYEQGEIKREQLDEEQANRIEEKIYGNRQ